MYMNILNEDKIMIIMDIKVNNLYLLNDFHMNMSYPKKIKNSTINAEYLKNRPNFKYKKLNIIMGANASGKTSLGKLLMHFFNYMRDGSYDRFIDIIGDDKKNSSLTIDFVTHEYNLYRFEMVIIPNEVDISNSNVNINIISTPIQSKDSYETCANRLNQIDNAKVSSIERNSVKTNGWFFSYPIDSIENKKYSSIENDSVYLNILESLLQTLDPAIHCVIKMDKLDNTYAIILQNHSVILQDGKILDGDILSSGTKAGIEISYIIASLICNRHDFFYCDELFSYVNSDIEKACLSIIIDKLVDGKQFFFTTHNSNVLDMQFPNHSFAFFKKHVYKSERNVNEYIDDISIECMDASKFLKNSKVSLRNAVENDLFCTSPDLNKLYEIATMEC